MPFQAPENPFATRYTRPGALPYYFRGGQSIADCVAALAANNWRGQILGLHGTGKSTLLASLREPLKQAGRKLISAELHDGQRQLPDDFNDSSSWTTETLLIVDGYEQLGWLARRQLAGSCRRTGCGALVTAHQSVGYPTVLTTKSDFATTEHLVRQLLGDSSLQIQPEEIATTFQANAGNIRDTLFELYDLYERRNPSR